ncbi:MAG TPA: 2-oxo-4-hydroxy-4-carboxy-5-ureidoimidazoline decarboxylase [Geminicoccaceae bacterium]|nr:2-oxo-4-hydroxy-4-carboxy-5-ureidoimidazoline decarboxylase [Geminicoccus sp.]HMU50403.1 2-oxo-4-hydroxy-4-carboxy-5-ureidoimidazoline decarboxylase [Geminicoccaceae bacterium]
MPSDLPSRPPSRMSRAEFVERFGGVFEHSPWIAEAAFDAGLAGDADSAAGLHARLCRVFRAASPERQMEVVLAHPDLAGRLALAGGLTADSTSEQKSAGLDSCTPAELARFIALNDAYKARFGMPFIMAVKGSGRAEILAAFEKRLDNAPGVERQTALAQIERIARLRLEAMLG